MSLFLLLIERIATIKIGVEVIIKRGKTEDYYVLIYYFVLFDLYMFVILCRNCTDHYI